MNKTLYHSDKPELYQPQMANNYLITDTGEAVT